MEETLPGRLIDNANTLITVIYLFLLNFKLRNNKRAVGVVGNFAEFYLDS